MTAVPFGFPRFIVRDPTTDAPLAGGRVFTFVAGTASTPKVAYADALGDTELPNPFTLDGDGGQDAFFEGAYKLRVERADGSLVYEIDGVGSAAGSMEGAIFGPHRIITNDYAVEAGDARSILQALRPTSLTMTFAACADLGAGFFVLVKNSGTGSVVFDPFQSETIDGVATKSLPPGASVLIYGDGISLFTILQSPVAGPGLQYSANGELSVALGDGIDLDGDGVAVNSTVVRTSGDQAISGAKNFTGNLTMGGVAPALSSRTIGAGTGLVGGGDLTESRSLSLNTSGRGFPGAYCLLEANVSVGVNEVVAGSDLTYARFSAGGAIQGSMTSPQGSWRNMADAISGIGAPQGYGLFIRVG